MNVHKLSRSAMIDTMPYKNSHTFL